MLIELLFSLGQIIQKKVLMLTGSGNYFMKDDSYTSTNIYLRRLFRDTYNADEVDAEECAEDVAADATELQNDYGFDDSPLCGEITQLETMV